MCQNPESMIHQQNHKPLVYPLDPKWGWELGEHVNKTDHEFKKTYCNKSNTLKPYYKIKLFHKYVIKTTFCKKKKYFIKTYDITNYNNKKYHIKLYNIKTCLESDITLPYIHIKCIYIKNNTESIQHLFKKKKKKKNKLTPYAYTICRYIFIHLLHQPHPPLPTNCIYNSFFSHFFYEIL